jgi:hypothetical protein
MYVEVHPEVWERWLEMHGEAGARVLAALKFLTHHATRPAYAGVSFLAEFAGVSVRTCQRILQALLDGGWIQRFRRFRRTSLTYLSAITVAVFGTLGATDRRTTMTSRLEADDPRRGLDRLSKVWNRTFRSMNDWLKSGGQRTIRIRLDPHAARGWVDIGALDDYETDEDLARELVRVVTQWRVWGEGKGKDFKPSCAQILDQMGETWEQEAPAMEYPQLDEVFREMFGEPTQPLRIYAAGGPHASGE